MALQVEGVVDGGMDAERPLCGAGRFEAVHFPLPRHRKSWCEFSAQLFVRSPCS